MIIPRAESSPRSHAILEKLHYLESNPINGGKPFEIGSEEETRIGGILKLYRKHSMLTQEEIEWLLDIPPVTISKIERADSISHPMIYMVMSAMRLTKKQQEDILYRAIVKDYNIAENIYEKSLQGLTAIASSLLTDVNNALNHIKE